MAKIHQKGSYYRGCLNKKLLIQKLTMLGDQYDPQWPILTNWQSKINFMAQSGPKILSPNIALKFFKQVFLRQKACPGLPRRRFGKDLLNYLVDCQSENVQVCTRARPRLVQAGTPGSSLWRALCLASPRWSSTTTSCPAAQSPFPTSPPRPGAGFLQTLRSTGRRLPLHPHINWLQARGGGRAYLFQWWVFSSWSSVKLCFQEVRILKMATLLRWVSGTDEWSSGWIDILVSFNRLEGIREPCRYAF